MQFNPPIFCYSFGLIPLEEPGRHEHGSKPFLVGWILSPVVLRKPDGKCLVQIRGQGGMFFSQDAPGRQEWSEQVLVFTILLDRLENGRRRIQPLGLPLQATANDPGENSGGLG